MTLVAKNFLYVRQIFLDNLVYFKFHTSYFFAKDAHLNRVMLQGTVENSLYVLPHEVTTSSQPVSQAFLGERIIPTTWHMRLGHSSPKTTSLTLRQH